MFIEFSPGAIVTRAESIDTSQHVCSVCDSAPAVFLTVREVAKLLRKTSKAIYVMIDRAQLPGVTRLGKRILIRREDLIAWLDESRAPSLKE